MTSLHPTVEPSDLGVSVDRHAEIPIGVQLAWALRARIGDGGLEPGRRLPGLRELADATGMNVNTVRAVYQRLSREGLIDTQQGSGTFVARASRAPSQATRIAAGAAWHALENGVDPRDVAAALYVSADATSAPKDRRAASLRSGLRAQIDVLERALAELEVGNPGLLPISAWEQRGSGPAILDASALEEVRAHLLRRLAAMQAAIDDRGRPDGGRAARRKATSSAKLEPSQARSKGSGAAEHTHAAGEAKRVAAPARRKRTGPTPAVKPA